MPQTPPDDIRWMGLALNLSQRNVGQTWPNPAVGCVLVKGTRVVGRGWTAAGGRPHAEVEALKQAGKLAQGSTAYVTLEPCAHIGQTGPCAQALIDAGIARAVVATNDPDPRVDGAGVAMLRKAGIEVAVGVLQGQADRSLAGFFKRIHTGRPWLTLKLAASIDGRIATESGESQWITGPSARRYVHLLRSQHDAVMVGVGTAIADDPILTVRGLGVERQPVRIICDTKLRTPITSNLGKTAARVPLWMLHGRTANSKAWVEPGARCLAVKEDQDGHLNLGQAMELLGEQGLTRVFCEGGGTLAAGLINAGLVDEIVTMHAGLTLGDTGLGAIAQLSGVQLTEFPRFDLSESFEVGGDVVSNWRRPDTG